MNGAESLVASLANAGVDMCFANPGTSEMHFLAALENPRIRSVLCLFEGVATGAADGWYRMKDEPACTLLHLGPGLANGLANLHNARRANSGVVNIVGEHAMRHLSYDAPLTSDIEGIARPVSHWLRRADTARSVASDALAAVAQARSHPGRIATLILPGETSWGQTDEPASCFVAPSGPKAPDSELVEHIARILLSNEPTLIVLGGRALRADALYLAGQIAAKTGCRLASQFFSSRIERGTGRVPVERIPYAVGPALQFLRGFKHIVTIETREPIAFFAYPDKPSRLKPADCSIHGFVELGEDSLCGLEMLVQALGAAKTRPILQPKSSPGAPTGRLDPTTVALAIGAALPEHAILVDESLTTGRESFGLTAGAPPHDQLQNMGGSIGFGTPVATGAALACPDRRVFCMVGDGSAMYTIQSLWTQAREGLNVTTMVFANNSYQILKAEHANMGAGALGPRALSMIDIDRPRIDWVAMGKSMGCPAVRVEDASAFLKILKHSVREPGPMVIEVAL